MDIPHTTLSNGVRMPMIGLGTFRISGPACTQQVRMALELGYTHIDTAAYYGNHADIERAMRGHDRRRLFITSKVWHDQLRHDDVLRSCDRILKELNTHYVDLLLVHWPNSAVPMEETFRALTQLYDQGKARAIGVSNFTIRHLEEALRVSRVAIAVNQVEFHPFFNQHELLAFCKAQRIQLVGYRPFANGLVFTDALITHIARTHEKSGGQVSLRWQLDKGVVVIPKACSREHLAENLGIDFTLTAEESTLLDNMPQQRLVHPALAEF